MFTSIRIAARLLIRRPAFACVAIVTLALGIGATATVASVLNAVVLRSLPYPAADGLVMIWSRWTAFEKTWLSELELFDYQRESRTLATVGAWATQAVNLTGGREPERVNAAAVSADLLPTLGTLPLHGRTFTVDEDRPGHDNVVVLGYSLWRRRFAASPGIVGEVIQVNGRGRTVVGVMPPGFMLPLDFSQPQPSELWVPLAIDVANASRGSHYLFAVGRLRPGATVAQARADVAGIAARRVAEGQYNPRMRFEALAIGLDDEVIGPVRPALVLLMVAVGLLILIACANVANLSLVQAEGRQREMAVRAAIGAGRGVVVRQLLTEALVLSTCGAVAGLALAWTAIAVIAAWPLASIPRLSAVTLDWTVLGVTIGVTVATAMLVSILPVLYATRLDIKQALHESTPAGAGPARQRVRRALVIAQVALAVMLVSAASLVLQSLQALQRIDPGFRPDGVITMRVSLPASSYPKPEDVSAFFERLLARVRATPGVASAGAVRSLPLADTIGDFGLMIEGIDPDLASRAKGDWQVATDQALETLGERLVRGRGFAPGDAAAAPAVAVINQTMANLYWPGEDPIGRRFKVGRRPTRPWVTIVGVVGDVRHNGLTGIVKEKFYVPLAQWSTVAESSVRSMVIVARTDQDPAGLVDPIRREVRALDADLPIADVRTMADVVAATTATPRFAGSVLGVFALVALALAAVGVYGVLSWVVARRTREIGVRLALGAEAGAVRFMVVRQGLRWGAIGAVVGVALAIAGARLLRNVVYGVSATDPLTLGVVLVTLVGVAGLAALVPARRATRVDPMVCLRVE